MTTRFLSFVALAGMLVAAGCSGGGGAGTTSGLTPSSPAAGGGANTGNTGNSGTLQAQFLIPAADVPAASTASNSRSAKYISPGTSGLQVLLGNGTTVTGGFSGGTASANTALTVTAVNGTANSAVLTLFNQTATPSVGQTLTVTQSQGNITNSGTTSLVQCQTAFPGANDSISYVVDTVVSPGNLQGHVLGVAGIAGGGGCVFASGGEVAYVTGGANPLGQQYVIGSATGACLITASGCPAQGVPSTAFGYVSAASVASMVFAASNVSGYYLATVTITNLVPQAGYTVGFVFTDTTKSPSTGGYVLSEGQLGGITVFANGPSTYNLTLSPVVAGAIAAPPALVYAGIANGNAATDSYETTVFATDELGYVVPSQAIAPDDASTLTLVPATAGQLTLGTWAAYGVAGNLPALQAPGNTVSPLDVAPGSAFVGGAATVTFGNGSIGGYTIFGTWLQNLNTPTAPGVPVRSATGAAIAGNPLNLTCAGTGTTSAIALKATLVNTLPTVPVTGYTYTQGTNYPAAAPPASTLTTVNCTPGFGFLLN